MASRLRSGRISHVAGFAGALLLTTATVVAAYSTIADEDGSAPPRESTGQERAADLPRWLRTSAPEPGPLGLQWRWMADSAQLLVEGRGVYWIAFWAQSRQGRRTLTISSSASRLSVRIDERPRPVVLGPLHLKGRSRLALSAQPPARPVGTTDSRALTAFLSPPSLSREPAALLPGRGFYPAEIDASGESFHWMSQGGTLHLLSRPAPRGWLTFVASSLRSRRLRISLARSKTDRVLTLPRGRPTSITFGPIPLRRGRAEIILTAVPGPSAISADSRRLSVQVRRLRVTFAAPRSD
jgi:hypothetical protein